MKILLTILLSITLSLALPLTPDNNKHEKRSIRASPSTNLEKAIDKTADSNKSIEKHDNQSTIHDDNGPKNRTIDLSKPYTEEDLKNEEYNVKALDILKHNNEDAKNDFFKILDRAEPNQNKDLRSDDLRIKVLDISKPTKERSLKAYHIRIGSPTVDVQEYPTIRASAPHIIENPHVIVNDHHFGDLSHSDLFHPQGSQIHRIYEPEHLFDIFQGVSSFEPIEISQGFEGFEEFLPIVETDVIQGLPVLGDFFEVSPPADPIHIGDEKIDTESDSITVESLGKLRESEAVNKNEGIPESRDSSQDDNIKETEKQLEPMKNTTLSEEPKKISTE